MWGLRWGFDLIDVNWVHALSYELNSPDVVILRDEEDAMPPQHFFASPHLEDLTEPSLVASRAAALMTLFDGAMYLNKGLQFRPERLGDLVDFRADRRLGGIAGVVGNAEPFSPTALARTLTRSEEEVVTTSRLEGAIFLSRTDRVVRGMLTMLGAHGVTFTSLYALRDFMKTHGFDDHQIAKAGGATEKELKLFTHTANNFAASGVDARHGDLGQQPPAAPMDLARASSIILGAAKRFIDARILDAARVRAEVVS